MEPDEILDVARRGAELGCKEALFTLGDRPETRWDEARQWLDERGYDSTLDYVRAMAIRVLEETGLLPHLNPGVMTWSELSRLKPVAPSMGMMLETTSRRLFETKGLAHYGSPDKDPEVRLRTLADAGRLSIPFTTGLLVGIGETLTERAETHARDPQVAQGVRPRSGSDRAELPGQGPHRDGVDRPTPVSTTSWRRSPSPAWCSDPKMRIQAPPNLVSRDECLALIGAGVDDWGGVSPLTPDHVNPERPWPALDELAAVTAEAGYDLVQRLTAQPQYVQAGAAWIDPRVQGARRCAGRSRHRLGAGRQPGRAAVAGARRGHRVARPHRPAFRDRHRGPADRPHAATSTARSATGSPFARRCASWPPGRRSASTPTCSPRCASPNAIRPAAPTTSIWRWPPPTVRRWKPLPRWRIRCAATSSATTSPSW